MYLSLPPGIYSRNIPVAARSALTLIKVGLLQGIYFCGSGTKMRLYVGAGETHERFCWHCLDDTRDYTSPCTVTPCLFLSTTSLVYLHVHDCML